MLVSNFHKRLHQHLHLGLGFQLLSGKAVPTFRAEMYSLGIVTTLFANICFTEFLLRLLRPVPFKEQVSVLEGEFTFQKFNFTIFT